MAKWSIIVTPVPKPGRSTASRLTNDSPFNLQRRKGVPHEFVLEALASLSPATRHMFGCFAIYVEGKIVLALRDKPQNTADNGVWLATTQEHHESLGREFPNMRSIQMFGKAVTGWQILPADSPDFESSALRACELIIARDPRIGKEPKARRISGSATKRARGNKEISKRRSKASEKGVKKEQGRD